jgi:uncharacterized protein (TIGR03086 family)
MDVVTLHRRTVELWQVRAAAVDADQWSQPTPCAQWNVRELVNHVVGEDRWTVPLLEGKTIADVGSSLDGDLLGNAPWEAVEAAADEAIAAAAAHAPADGKVHLSYGDEDMAEYLLQLAADHLIHAWDLARATKGDTALDEDLVAEVADWFADREELYRKAGIIGAPGPLSGDPQSDLLARSGRDPQWNPNHAVLAAFNAAFARGDVEGALALTTSDAVFESTSPGPDGHRYVGTEELRAVWTEVLATPGLQFTEEESFISGDRAVVRWRFSWGGGGGEESAGHVRGVDVIKFRDGKLSEKLSYVKG